MDAEEWERIKAEAAARQRRVSDRRRRLHDAGFNAESTWMAVKVALWVGLALLVLLALASFVRGCQQIEGLC